MSIIQPRTLKGFRDYEPGIMALRERIIDTARDVCRSYGYSPIDTPALEYSEILLGKGGDESDKQLYRFEDQGGRDIALRFDLTVPLARFAAQHVGKLGTPFKRYHVGPVWRGENTQRGRYREFVQFDFDTIGTDSLVADIETIVVVHELFASLGFGRFRIRINNRQLLNGVLERLDLTDRAGSVLRALDKLQKIGRDAVAAELVDGAGITAAAAGEILTLADLAGSNDAILAALPAIAGDGPAGRAGVAGVAEVLTGAIASGVPEERLQLDVSIARGLAYYTGTVFETFLDDLPGIGSVCSGGRYDDLASLYTTQRLPGIGGSLGVDRLVAAMEGLDLVGTESATAAVFVPFFASEQRDRYLALCSRLRAAGLSVEFYPEPRKLSAQIKYADRRGHRLAIIIGTREWEAGTAQVKQLQTGESAEIDQESLVAECRKLLAGDG